MRVTGEYDKTSAAGEVVQAFVPFPLPPDQPKLVLDAELIALLDLAEKKLVHLDLASRMLPSLDWFIYAYVRKEAVTSSQIEGTQATLIDLLSFEAEGELKQNDDIDEVCNYLHALKYARRLLQDKNGLPLSMRLLNETHKRLMKGVRGHNKQPGEIRRSQNWIGGSRPGLAAFVPPPSQRLPKLLSDLERYIHQNEDLPPLIRLGLIHVQFETIHPYLDGNGRIGRLLITLATEHWQLLNEPLLYLSLYFKKHRNEYYDLLGAVRRNGDWEAWLKFFLKGVAEIALDAVTLIKDLSHIVQAGRYKVLAEDSSTIFTAQLFEMLPTHPMVTMTQVVNLLKTTKPTALKCIGTLVKLGILKEITGRKRDRCYSYAAYLDKLKVGTEL